MKQGLLQEALVLKKILLEKFSDIMVKARFYKLGLSYKNIYSLWDGEISEEEFIKRGITEEGKYAKRQNTYLKKFFQSLPRQISKHKYNLLKENYAEDVFKDLVDFLK